MTKEKHEIYTGLGSPTRRFWVKPKYLREEPLLPFHELVPLRNQLVGERVNPKVYKINKRKWKVTIFGGYTENHRKYNFSYLQ